MLVAIVVHLLWRSVFNTESQPTCCCHSCWRKGFAGSVPGDTKPSGSKICEDHFKISCFVVTDKIEGSALGERWIMSF